MQTSAACGTGAAGGGTDQGERTAPSPIRSALFQDLEEWDFAASRLPTYRALLRELRRVDEAIHGGTKFWAMSRYRLADRMFIAAPVGLIRARELPPGWGLLEATRTAIRGRASGWDGLRLTVPGGEVPSKEIHQTRMLRQIAAAATRDSAIVAQLQRDRTNEASLFEPPARSQRPPIRMEFGVGGGGSRSSLFR